MNFTSPESRRYFRSWEIAFPVITDRGCCKIVESHKLSYMADQPDAGACVRTVFCNALLLYYDALSFLCGHESRDLLSASVRNNPQSPAFAVQLMSFIHRSVGMACKKICCLQILRTESTPALRTIDACGGYVVHGYGNAEHGG